MSGAQNKNCGKCDKIVYPTEEIKCLDKLWHKGCLKCTVCGTTLNVKNVKGYGRMPYCQVHYPQPKPTVVVDNPEMQRMRLLTDIQSTAKYHEDFNKSKGKFTPITDDPAATRAKEQQKMVSQAEYTGKRKDSNSQVVSTDNQSAIRTLISSQSTVGRVADYDPINDHHGSLTHGYEPTSKVIHSTKFEGNPKSEQDDRNENHHFPQPTGEESPVPSNPHHSTDSVDNEPSIQMKVRALYSYVAAESDELSFTEGDTLVNCEHIDAGWMIGRHPITDKQGLLPSNYVQIID